MAVIDVKKASAQDIPELARLADEVFRTKVVPGEGMAREFPTVFSESNSSNLYFAEADGRPVSMIGLMPKTIHVFGHAVSAVLMGAVCTLSEYRGQGLASRLLEEVLTDWKNVSLLIISGDRDLYRRIGSVPFGRLRALSISSKSLHLPPDDVVIRSISDDEIPKMCQIYGLESCRFHRTADEMKKLIEGWRWASRFDGPGPLAILGAYRHGVMEAYIVARGGVHDGHPTIYEVEWAGSRNRLLALAEGLLKHFSAEEVSVIGPWEDREFRDLAENEGVSDRWVPNSGTLRLMNPERLTQEFEPWLEEQHGVQLRIQEQRWADSATWTIEMEGSGAKASTLIPRNFDDRGALVRWLFAEDGLNLPMTRTNDLNFV